MKIAALADIHGNRWALEAVLEDLERRRPDRILHLGDYFYGPLDPAGTARLLRQLEGPAILGNQDRVLLNPPPGLEDNATFKHVEGALDEAALSWLRNLPKAQTGPEGLLLCHGTPRSDEEYLLEEVRPEGVRLRSEADIAARLPATDATAILCGHTHVARSLWLAAESLLVVNPGSVGLPAYTDDAPHPHTMESGSPHARYALLERRRDSWRLELVAVPYDWTAAAAVARDNNREDWARWLLKGRD